MTSSTCHHNLKCPGDGRRRRSSAATLLEMVLSMAAISVLLAGMASAVYLAGEAATPQSIPASSIDGSLLASDIAAELQFAEQILSADGTSIQFTRTRGGNSESIAYSWSGTPGDPLTRAVDGGTAVNVADNVHSFELEYFENTAATANLISNEGLESGANDWSGYLCDVDVRDILPHSGTYYLRASNRQYYYSGPRQFVTGHLHSGVEYQLDAWAFLSSGTKTIRLSLYTFSDGEGEQVFQADTSPTSQTWQRVSATLTPNWSGQLQWAYVKISTNDSDAAKPDLYVDDVSMMVNGSGTPVELDGIGVAIQIGNSTQTRTTTTARLLHHPIWWQP